VTSAVSETVSRAWRKVRAAAGLGDPINRLIRTAPRPLIHSEARMIVVFSPKSACSNVVIWFLHQLGLAEEARAYHDWPHRYRINVYYQSDLYRQALSLDLKNFRVVRVLRDPIDRAVSTFREVQRSALADELSASILGRTDAAEAGVSFSEFLDLLEKIDLRVRTHKGSPDRGIVIHGVELEDTDDSLAFLADEGSVFSAQAAVAE
jgi:hypothetical protein